MRFFLLAFAVASAFTAPAAAQAQSAHILDNEQCSFPAGDFAAHLRDRHQIALPAAGESGFGYGAIAVKSNADCERIRKGEQQACVQLKGANCSSIPSCAPTTGTGSTAGKAPSTEYTAKALTQAITTGKVDAPTQLGAAFELGATMGSAIGDGIRQANEANRIRAEQERLMAEQAARDAAEARERQHLAVVASIRPLDGERLEPLHERAGAPFDGNQLLNDPGVVQISSLDQSPMMLRPVAEEGGPIPQCAEWRESATRLRAGLGPTKEAIDRTDAVLRTAKMDKHVADAAFVKARRDAALAVVNETAGRYMQIDARIRKTAGRDVSDLHKRLDETKAWIDRLNTAANGLREQGALEDPAKMKEFIRLTREASTSLEKVQELAESPAMQASADIAASFVPVAALTLELGKSGIDMIAAYGSGRISDAERKSAQETLRVLETQYRRAQLEANERERDLALFRCPT